MKTDFTHDVVRRSWVDGANHPECDFPLQNLPYGVFRTAADPAPRLGTAIGERILDLRAAGAAGLLPASAASAGAAPTLNALMAAGPAVWHELRVRLSELLGADTCEGERRLQVQACLVPLRGAEMLLPAQIGDYTDFYASIHHATNVGSMFRPENPLLPNYKWVPIGYHGRGSSIQASGTQVRRPSGQVKSAEMPAPVFGPCRNLDYELELGAFVGPGNRLGERIPLAQADRHLFGVVLLNDWSARDIQTWEYQPLGPFLAKNFATTISPWVVTLEALAPFRGPVPARPAGDPAPLPYLTHPDDAADGAIDLTLDVSLLTAQMRLTGAPPYRLSRGNFSTMYWTLGQMLAHHASNGCNLCPGDLLGSGTVSGPTKESRGCMLELTWRGTDPVRLPNGEERRFLADGDEVILRGFAERPGARRIGFGECRGTILPAN
jgi:fumarylacetoacetase